MIPPPVSPADALESVYVVAPASIAWKWEYVRQALQGRLGIDAPARRNTSLANEYDLSMDDDKTLVFINGPKRF